MREAAGHGRNLLAVFRHEKDTYRAVRPVNTDTVALDQYVLVRGDRAVGQSREGIGHHADAPYLRLGSENLHAHLAQRVTHLGGGHDIERQLMDSGIELRRLASPRARDTRRVLAHLGE